MPTATGLRPIEEVRANEEVWACDVVTGHWRLCRVLHTYSLEYHGRSAFVSIDGDEIEATYRHPFWVLSGADLAERPRLEHLPDEPREATVPGRWEDAGDLRVGDEVVLRDGRAVFVTGLRIAQLDGRVHNFEVDDLHCYAVGRAGILVHNNNGPDVDAPKTLPEVFGNGADKSEGE